MDILVGTYIDNIIERQAVVYVWLETVFLNFTYCLTGTDNIHKEVRNIAIYYNGLFLIVNFLTSV